MDAILPDCLFRSWGHSFEEDGDGITVFRPAGFSFPLSRGRDWIEFHTDGTVVFYGAAPDDRSRTVTGRWVVAKEGSLEISKGETGTPQRLEIIECTRPVLKVRRR